LLSRVFKGLLGGRSFAFLEKGTFWGFSGGTAANLAGELEVEEGFEVSRERWRAEL